MRRLLNLFKHIKVRLTLWYVFLLAIVLIVFSIVLYFSLKGSLLNEVDNNLSTMGKQVITNLDYEDGQLSFQNNEEPGDPLELLVSEGYAIRLVDGEGGTLEGTGSYRDVFDQGQDIQKGFDTVDIMGTRWRVYTIGISTGREELFLQIGQSLGRIDSTLSKLLYFELIAIPLVLAFAIAVGMFLAGRALKPVEEITQLAGSTQAVDMSGRLDLDLPDDELGRLAKTFNDMLARLEESFASQRRFVSEAAHELRTPLTVMKGTAEVSLARDRTIAEYKEALEELRVEVDHLVDIAEDLLTLSSSNSERPTLDKQDLDLVEVVRSTVSLAAPLAKNRGMDVEFKSAGSIRFTGDRSKLTRMLLNLLDNAVKYSSPGSTISVSTHFEREKIVVAVSDDGPGIDAGELDYIFDSFHRLEEAREKNPSGTGLGLSIARWIARAHGGEIEVESQPGQGSTFSVSLPYGDRSTSS
jgi:heavy metal sensor kinase